MATDEPWRGNLDEIRCDEIRHTHVTAGLGFLLPPDIETGLKSHRSSPIRIADAKCGSGVWLSEATKQYAGNFVISGDGFDVSDSLFPESARSSSPTGARSNINYRILDVTSKSTLPDDLVGQFDVVVVRFMHVSLRDDQWDQTMRNLIDLLRPGGYLSWTDWDPLTARIAATKPGAKDAMLREVFQRYTDVLRAQKVGSTYRLPKSMGAHGLVEIDSDLYPVPPSFEFTRLLANDALAVLELDAETKTSELERLKLGADEELQAQGCLLWYDLWCHTAKKPADEMPSKE